LNLISKVISTMASLALRRTSKISSFLSIHCPFWMEKTQEQRESTAVGFSGLFLVAGWSAEKLDPRLFLKNRRTDRVHSATKSTLVEPSKLHSVCSWVSSIGNRQWMERKLLQTARIGLPKTPWCWWSAPQVDSQVNRKSIQIKSQANPRVFTQNLINSSARGSAIGHCDVSSGFLMVTLSFLNSPFFMCFW